MFQAGSRSTKCPVAPLAAATAALLLADATHDRIEPLITAATAQAATSAQGALFQLALATDYADQLYALAEDSDTATAAVGNIVRCLYSVRRFIEAETHEVVETAISEQFMADDLDPHRA